MYTLTQNNPTVVASSTGAVARRQEGPAAAAMGVGGAVGTSCGDARAVAKSGRGARAQCVVYAVISGRIGRGGWAATSGSQSHSFCAGPGHLIREQGKCDAQRQHAAGDAQID